ncbi:uncharacterized protein B0H18DRAFT_977493 [Fomitopsis serialis]|uniref:uncharacterized protein n=1 Tax=Fomitopsis serialis TaxID=139415 RepID=UPI002008B652|nr:uncharacterized protein B0H18DRAFT_977493 [Neoantrodia serialis]KAH9934635.1 hypothetical protein B0H18DRAFT_977493 [Neoantrodia serialis]
MSTNMSVDETPDGVVILDGTGLEGGETAEMHDCGEVDGQLVLEDSEESNDGHSPVARYSPDSYVSPRRRLQKRDPSLNTIDVELNTENMVTSGSDSDDDELHVLDQSMDIRASLETVLNGDLAESFKGSYAFNCTYTDAPNPGLHLSANNIGIIGLPLSQREAKVVMSGCRPATKRSAGDIACGAWVMDASQVLLRNSAWEGFIQRVVGDACAAFGVDVEESEPRCEFSQMLFYEAGAHIDKSNDVFAIIHVVLPSEFTGGALQVLHESQRTVLNGCADSALKTTVHSWHADAIHELQPITSGYRLALSYNILHAPNAPRPTLSNDSAAIAELRHVLLSWKQSTSADTPRKIVYLLDHHYPQADLKASSLKGPDAHKLSLLRLLAQQHGFCLGLATFERYLYGRLEDNSYRLINGVSDFDDVYDESTCISDLVNLDGDPLQSEVEFVEEYMIPEDPVATVESGAHDEQTCDESGGDELDFVKRWYRRTALVIWPRQFDLNKTFEDDISSMAKELAEAGSGALRKRERELVEFLFNLAQAHTEKKDEVARAVCAAASFCQDFELWKRAASLCEATVKALGTDIVLRSVESFGFQFLLPMLEEMVLMEVDNIALFRLFDALENWAMTNQAVPKQDVLDWVSDQRILAMNHLAKPTTDDCQALLCAALRYGGITALQDTVVPQLSRISDPDFLLSFAESLRQEKLKPEVSLEDQVKISTMCVDILSAAIRRADFSKATKSETVKFGHAPYTREERVPDPAIAMTYVDACLTTDSDKLVGQLVQKLTDMPHLHHMAARTRMKQVLMPLIPLVKEKVRARPANAPALPSITGLYEKTVQLYLQTWPPQTAPTKDDLVWLVQTSIVYCGGIDFLEKQIWPALSSVAYADNAMLELIDLLRVHAHVLPASRRGSSIQSLTLKAVRCMIKRANFGAGAKPQAQPDVIKAIELLSLCHKTDCMTSCSLLFRQLLAPPSISPEYIEHILVPFIPALRQFLLEKGLSLSDEPCNAVFKTILMLWAKHVLGPKPNDTPADMMLMLQSHRCTCTECTQAFQFLTSGEDKERQMYRIGAAKRKHVETQLTAYARRCATWTPIRTSPQGLTITKGDVIYRPVKWKANIAKVPQLLASISLDDEELRRILGPDYQVIMDMMDGRMPETAANTTIPSRLGNGQYVPNQSSSVQSTSSLPQGVASGSVTSTHPTKSAPSISASVAQSATSAGRTQTSIAPPPASTRPIVPVSSAGQAAAPLTVIRRTKQAARKSAYGRPPGLVPPTNTTPARPATRGPAQPASTLPSVLVREPDIVDLSAPRMVAPRKQSARKSAYLYPPRLAGSTSVASAQPAASMQSSASATALTSPNRKRKRARVSYDTSDVIDLTDD